MVFPVIYSRSGLIYEIQNEHLQAWATNISEGGLGFECVHPIDPNFPIKLNFEFDENRHVEVYGKIAWSFDHHCGVRFLGAVEGLNAGIRATGKK